MPYATRQAVIDFPKKKHIAKETKGGNIQDVIKTPDTKIIKTSASSSARKAFHTFSGITGRQKEVQQLTDFLLTHLCNQYSGSLYVSGLPGTGKTATVNYVIEENELNRKYQIVKINCTAFNSSNAVFKRICESLKLKSKKTEKEAVAAIEKYLIRKHKIVLLVLDEIDQLENKTHSVLYKIFEWASWKNSKLVLIGIANAMDLTDRILPRLCTKVELKPTLLHFPPYTKLEITEILKSRLTEAGVDKIFAPGAIELIAAKVAGTSGDIRRALDLGKRVVEIAELKNQKENGDIINSNMKSGKSDSESSKNLKRKLEDSYSIRTPSKLDSFVDEIVNSVNTFTGVSPQKLLRNKNGERVCRGEITPQKSSHSNLSPRKSPRRKLYDSQCDSENFALKFNKSPGLKKSPVKSLKEEVVLRRSPRKLQFDIDSKDVLNVVKNVFASSKNLKTSEESTFPLHQKLLICTLLLIIKKGQKKDLNIGKLHQVYSKVCAKRALTAVDKSGFLFLCKQVEVSGILHIGKGNAYLAKVALRWDEAEVAESLKDLALMSSILNDTSCLS